MANEMMRHRYNNFRSDLLYPRILSEKAEDELNEYISNANLKGVAVNKDIIIKKALEIAHKNNE